MIRKVLVDGETIELEPCAPGQFRLAGKQDEVSAVQVRPGVWSVLIGGRSFEVIEDGGSIVAGGRRHSVEVLNPRTAARKGAAASLAGRQAVKSVMPGKIVRLLVQEGDSVEAGQGLIVVEAMKMQNEIKSPKAGKVVSLPAQEGAAVAAGVLLAEVE